MSEAGAQQRTADLRSRLQVVRDRIERAAAAAGRDPQDITLVVVTKFFPAADVVALADLGVVDIGESRDQEAGAKLQDLPDEVRDRLRVHFIGQLQSNKAAHVAAYADVVQSVDRAKIARALSRAVQQRAAADGSPLEVLIQVDLSGEQGRGGADPAQALGLADEVADLPGLRLRGTMAVAPLGADPAPAFADLARLSAAMRSAHPDADQMSAGMSGDLEAAVHAGATHLRVGSAILGSRPAQR